MVSLLVAGLAAPIVAHAFGATNAPRMAMVGAPAVFASQSSAAPTTSLPAGTENGTFLVTFVATAPSSTVHCGWGWIKRFDQVNGNSTRLVACTRTQTAGARLPRANLAPAGHVTMVTMAFSGVDPAAPVGLVKTQAGFTGPSVKTTRANSMVVLAEGSPHWRFAVSPPRTAARVAAITDRSASQIVTALQPAANAGTVAAGVWTREYGDWRPAASVTAPPEHHRAADQRAAEHHGGQGRGRVETTIPVRARDHRRTRRPPRPSPPRP